MRIFIVFIFFWSNFINGQTWERFVNWNEGECIASQNDSIIWIGTKVGLIKRNLNNNSFESFNSKNGLMSPAVNDIVFDSEGNLWMATDNGIVKYDGKIFELFNYRNTPPLPNAAFNKIEIDLSNNIYASTKSYKRGNHYNFSSIVCRYNDEWKIFHGDDYNFSWYASDIAFFNDRIIILLPFQIDIWTTKLFTFNNGELSQLGNSKINQYGYNLTIDHEDSLWISCSGYLYKYRNENLVEIINKEDENIGDLWKYVWSDKENGLWLSGDNNWSNLFHLNIEDNRNGIKYSLNLPEGIKQVNNTHISTQGYLNHLGDHYFVSKDGLAKLTNSQLTFYKIPKTIEQNEIFGLGISPKNEILVSGPNATQRFDGINWVLIGDRDFGYQTYNKDFRFSLSGQLYTNFSDLIRFSSGLDFDGKSNLWTAYPVIEYKWPRLSPNRITIEEMGINVPENHRSPQFMDVIVDKFEHIWFVGWYGYIAMFDGTRWHSYDSEDIGSYYSLNLDYAFTDSKGRKWFADNQTSPNEGLIMYNETSWDIINFPELYRGQYIYQAVEDHLGNIWFASETGLLKYDNTNWYIYNKDNSEVDFTSVNAVTVDERGNIWAGTNKGIYVYNKMGIDFVSNLGISPVDSFKVYYKGEKVIAKITVNKDLSNLKNIELQRGINPHKFWTISVKEYLQNNMVELSDSSLILGHNFYRIKAIDKSGKAYFSDYKEILGDSVGVEISNFHSEKLENKLLFHWTSINEKYVNYYELHSVDLSTSIKTLLAKVMVNEKDSVNNYTVVGENLVYNAVEKKYILYTVFSDSTLIENEVLLETPSFPKSFSVSQNFPNPFNSITKFKVSLPFYSKIKIEIFNILGELISTFTDKEYEAGTYTIPLVFNNCPSGIYIYKISTWNDYKTGKMVFLK